MENGKRTLMPSHSKRITVRKKNTRAHRADTKATEHGLGSRPETDPAALNHRRS